jgi:RHS repeat-associated protein
LNRLKFAQEKEGTTEVWKQTFTYDRFGNRRFDGPNTTLPQITQQNETSTNPTISTANNQISAAGYRYDLGGNLECDPTHPCGAIAPFAGYFEYDGENRIKTANGGSSSGGSSYFYDADGRRVKKIVGGPTTITTVFVYDMAGKLIAEYSDQQPSTGGTTYVTSDQLGTPRVLTHADGTVIGRHDYQPFGEEIARPGIAGYPGTDGLRQRFTLYERDLEISLDYAVNRYYGFALGRFTSVDPLTASAKAANPQTWNRYAYCGNNPLARIDPNGLDWYYDSFAENAVPTWFDHDPGGTWRRWTGTYSLVYYHRESRQWVALDPNGNNAFINKDQNLVNRVFERFAGGNSDSGVTNAERDFLAGIGTGTSPFGILAIPFLEKNGIDTTSREFAWGSGFVALGGGIAFAGSKIVSGSGLIRVGRWMSYEEYNAMVSQGVVQESRLGGVTSVTVPPNPGAYRDAVPKSVFVEFDVPANSVRTIGGQGWGKIYGPNSLFGPRLGITQMPPATGIVPIVSKVKP